MSPLDHRNSGADAANLTRLFIGLERLMRHDGTMKHVTLPALALTITGLCAPASAQDILASPWLDFREAKVRLVVARLDPKIKPLVAALEIQLADGFKTYWRTAGDSGVPPMFDFTQSTGMEAIEVRYPFPSVFDDGAGGKAWGYKHAVAFPIAGRRIDGAFMLHLKLDFAVCGTMCIPLSGEVQFDASKAERLSGKDADILDRAALTLPTELAADAAPAPVITRQQPADPPVWALRLPYHGAIEEFAAFPEAKGFLEVTGVAADGPGFAKITITGQAAPGSGGLFGPVRLTYGRPGAAYERMIDLDVARASP